MGSGKSLSDAEIKTILTLRKENYSVSKIARIIHRSRKVVYNLLKNPKTYGTKKSSGRPKAVSNRGKRAILKEASNSSGTSRQIAKAAGVHTNIRNVQRIIKECPHLVRMKLKKKPPLTAQHKSERLKFAQEHIHWRKKWRRVIFSDEKRFNLDGPDGFAHYFHDLRKEERILSRRHMGGGGVMLWAGIGYRGVTEVKFINKTMNSKIYIDLIDEQLTKFGQTISGENCIFQQDNASVHTAKCVKQYFEQNKISVLT